MCCWRSRRSRLLLRLDGQSPAVVERTINPLPQLFPVSRQSVSENHSGLRLAPGHRFEHGRSVQAKEARAILLGEPEHHALLAKADEQVAVDKAAWPAEHLLLLHTRVLWSKLAKEVHQFGRRLRPVHSAS